MSAFFPSGKSAFSTFFFATAQPRHVLWALSERDSSSSSFFACVSYVPLSHLFYCFSVEAFNIIFIVSSGLRIFAQHSRNVAPSESYFCTCVCDEMCFCRIQCGELSYVWNATWLLRAIVNTGFWIQAAWFGIYMRSLHIWGSWISQLP